MPRSLLETEPVQIFRIALPLAQHLDVQAQVDRGAQQPVDLEAGSGPDLPQPASLVADDDPLLGVAFHDDGGEHVQEGFVLGTVRTRQDLIDHHRYGVREFVAHPARADTSAGPG